MKRLGVLSFFLFFCITLRAQIGEDHRVSGRVINGENDEPMEMVTVVLLEPEDSSLVTGTTTDSTGRFELEVGEGDYLFEAKYVGYQSRFVSDVSLDGSNPREELGQIVLEPSANTTSEVEVQGEKSEMTLEEGKKIFNVGTNLANSGASASDVLDNIPSVSTDIEGNISVRGSQGVRILINGKPSSMMGISESEALRYFPANQIERVEVITNPSAKYEAQGAGGIINIILKDNVDWGLNGTFTLEGGMPHDHGASISMNYRKKWFNIFGSYNFGYTRAPGGGWREQIFEYPDTTYSLRTDEDQSRGGLDHDIQLGSDFYFTPNDVLKVSGVYSVGDQDNYTDLTFSDYSGDRIHEEDLVQKSRRSEHEMEEEGDHELNLSYEKTFGEEEHKLTVDLQGRNSVEVEDASLVETEGLTRDRPDTVQFQNSLNSTDVRAYMGKLDYTWPFSDEGEFETGLRAEQRDITNIFNVERRDSESDPWNTLDRFSNTFLYTEEIYGAYAMFNDKSGDFGYQAGLRYEYTGISTELEDEGGQSERSYSNFFPSLSLSYDINDTTSIQASYSRRLDRPYFRELNPYNTFNNNRVYSTGNSQLDPEFTGAYDLGFVSYNSKGSIYIGGFYRRTQNEIEDVDTINDEGVTIVKPYNLASRNNVGLETRYNRDLTDWWNFSVSAHFYYGETRGNAAGENLNASTLTMDGQVRTDIDVKDWFDLQFSADYRAPEQEGQDRERAMYEINAGLRKSVLDDRGNIAFSVRDMFNTDIYRSYTDGSNFTARRKHQWRRGPFFSLSVSYELKDDDAEADENTNIFGEGDEG